MYRTKLGKPVSTATLINEHMNRIRNEQDEEYTRTVSRYNERETRRALGQLSRNGSISVVPVGRL